MLLLAPVTDPAASRTRWPPRSACRTCAATSWRPASRSSATGRASARRRQLRAPARRRARHGRRGPGRPARSSPCWPPAGSRSGSPPSAPPGWRRSRCPPGPAQRPRRTRAGAASPPWRSSSTAPPGSGRGSPPMPDELRLVADIVRRLDGMPLAIELAAGRLSTFSLADLAQRLDRALDLLGGGRAASDARHRTLRSTVEWSYRAPHRRRAAAVPAPVGLRRRRRPRHRRVRRRRPRPRRRPGKRAGPPRRRVHDRRHVRGPRPATACSRRCGRSASTGWPRPAKTPPRLARLLRWAVELTARIDADADEPSANRRPTPPCVGSWPTCGPRGAWLASTPASIDAAAMVHRPVRRRPRGATSPRPGAGPRSWPRPCARRSPPLGRRARLRRERRLPARRLPPRPSGSREPALERATDAEGSLALPQRAGLAELSRGAYDDGRRACTRRGTRSRPEPSENLGIAALALTYAGDLDPGAGSAGSMSATAASPTMLGFAAYVSGEIDHFAGHPDRAEAHYARAIDLARSSGASFLVGHRRRRSPDRARRRRSHP